MHVLKWGLQYYDMQNPRDVTILRLHGMATVSALDSRRDVQLLNIMFKLKQTNNFWKEQSQISLLHWHQTVELAVA